MSKTAVRIASSVLEYFAMTVSSLYKPIQ